MAWKNSKHLQFPKQVSQKQLITENCWWSEIIHVAICHFYIYWNQTQKQQKREGCLKTISIFILTVGQIFEANGQRKTKISAKWHALFQLESVFFKDFWKFFSICMSGNYNTIWNLALRPCQQLVTVYILK